MGRLPLIIREDEAPLAERGGDQVATGRGGCSGVSIDASAQKFSPTVR
jgi:hypothetical protein